MAIEGVSAISEYQNYTQEHGQPTWSQAYAQAYLKSTVTSIQENESGMETANQQLKKSETGQT